ncbi:MAG: hypothetical protein WCA07_10830 [Gloeobacterales cyanobacterium]
MTDKIFPWVVETALMRVEMEGLRASLKTSEQVNQRIPEQISKTVAELLEEPLEQVRASNNSVSKLSLQLFQSTVLEASLSQSGWLGMMAAAKAIGRHKNLAIVVGVIALISGLIGGKIAWQLGAGNRELLSHNDAVIKQCYKRFLPTKGKQDWFTCPGLQLPRQR